MKFNKQYYSYYLNLNILRKIGRRFFSPKVYTLFKIVQELPNHSKALDAGAGTGGFLQLIEQTNPKLKTFGIDIGTPPIFTSNGIFIRGDIIQLPFKDNSFDLVTCSHVIEHLRDPFLAVVELCQICKPDGYIYLEAPSHMSTLMPIGMNFWDDPTHIRPFTRTSLKKLLENCELKIIKDGVKHSLAGIFFGFPYMFIGKLLGDPLSRIIFPMYTFGLSVYAIGKKQNSDREK